MLGTLLLIDTIVYGFLGLLLLFLPVDMIDALYAGEHLDSVAVSGFRLAGGATMLAGKS